MTEVAVRAGGAQPRFAFRSPELALHMRTSARAARAESKAEETHSKLDHTTQALSSVCVLLPAAAQLVNAPPAKQIGRKKKFEPKDVVLAVRAVHLPPNMKVNLGVRLERLKRLKHAGAQVVLGRQEAGLQQALRSLQASLADAAATRIAHMSLVHLWDEVEVKFQWAPQQLRTGRGATTLQTLVQRGHIGFFLFERGQPTGIHIAEHWIKPPQEASGTSAEAWARGLESSWPTGVDLYLLASLKSLLLSVTSVTYMPCCDKASGNMALLRHWAHEWETKVLKDPDIGGRFLVWPDVCSAHLHHRAKLQVKSLKQHTVRQFAVAKLMRLRGNQAKVLQRLEELIDQKLRRVVQPQPVRPALSMHDIVDLLLKLDDPHHDRRRGKS